MMVGEMNTTVQNSFYKEFLDDVSSFSIHAHSVQTICDSDAKLSIEAFLPVDSTTRKALIIHSPTRKSHLKSLDATSSFS